MRVRHLVTEFPGLPAPQGAHRLAWSYLLDAAFADAFHAGVTQLDLRLPAALADEVQSRDALAPDADADGGPQRRAIFGIDLADAGSAVRCYRLRPGPLAPAGLRAAAAGEAPARFERVASLYVYTLASRLLGVPMRLFNLLSLPQPADRALIALRHTFASARPTPCYYLLETWQPRR